MPDTVTFMYVKVNSHATGIEPAIVLGFPHRNNRS